METSNLFLETFTKLIDLDEGFEEFRKKFSGESDSNMTKIDSFMGIMPITLAAISANASASATQAFSSFSNASGSINSFSGSLANIDQRFVKIATHSGSGRADFNVSGSYTHLMLFGFVLLNTASQFGNVACDFNGDSGSANYRTTRWDYSGSSGSASNVESFTSASTTAQIHLGKAAWVSTESFGSPFFAIIPNYSYSGSSGSMYKTAMGISALAYSSYLSSAMQGGTWMNSGSINRIRIFGTTSGSTRIDFANGTIITLYGIK